MRTQPVRNVAAIMIGPRPEAIEAARKSLLMLMTADCSDPVKLAAINALENLCEVTNTTINSCTFHGIK